MKTLISVVLSLCLISPATAKPWQEAIDDVSSLAEQYKDAAEAKSGERITYWLGTIHAVTDVDMHMCAILGRRLGHADAIGHLEPPQPPLNSDPQILANNYASLSNWVHAASWFAGMSQHERATRWNLECVGKMGTPTGLWVEVPSQVFYSVERDYIWVYGDIVSGFADRLKSALEKHPEVNTVGIGSAGGHVWEALQAGRYIRSHGLSTQLTGSCASACPIFFLGGVNRTVLRPYPQLGFHKASSSGVAVPNSHPVYNAVWAYAQEMGANPDFFVSAMLSREPNDMGYLTPDAACQSGIVTWYQGVVTDKC